MGGTATRRLVRRIRSEHRYVLAIMVLNMGRAGEPDYRAVWAEERTLGQGGC
jgi:hypothetical protein